MQTKEQYDNFTHVWTHGLQVDHEIANLVA